MNIGDKVRVIHGKEEGVVVGFQVKGLVEVMLTDGFRIPFAKSDLVVVSALEDKVFAADKKEETSSSESKKILFSEKGVFLAKTSESDGTQAFYLINNTDFQLLFTSFLLRPNQDAKALSASTLNKKTSFQVFYTTQVSLLEEGKLMLQILFFSPGRNEVKLPLIKEVDLRPKSWKKESVILPVLNKQGAMLQLDISLDQSHASELSQSLGEKIPMSDTKSPAKPQQELDLHIEKLVNNHYSLKPDEMLRYQLRAFENHLEKSICRTKGSCLHTWCGKWCTQNRASSKAVFQSFRQAL